MADFKDDHFRTFASSLEHEIAKYGEVDMDFDERQKTQVELLVALEAEFRQTLIAHRWGPSTYKDFVKLICDDKANILAARPYFRERQQIFTTHIAPALKARDAEALYPFAFNYQFVLFAMKSRQWERNRMGTPIVELARRITVARLQLVETNMPLAISRARIFSKHASVGALSYMDLVQISCEGLMSAVDKYVLPFSTSFRNVIIGRIVGNFIEHNSATMLHFYPVDKRKIYRANKHSGRVVDIGIDDLVEQVNMGKKALHHTDAGEIADLMLASSCVSLEQPGDKHAEAAGVDVIGRPTSMSNQWAVAPEEQRPDIQAENNNALARLVQALGNLSVYERKLLRLRGVEFSNVSL